MPSPFSDKEREVLGQIREAEERLHCSQSSLNDWNLRISGTQKTLDQQTQYRDSYAEKVKDAQESLVKLKTFLKELLTAVDKPAPAPELKPAVVEDCVDQLESRSKVEAPHARDKDKRDTGKRHSNKGRSR
jgi:hypothetical protein